ncbi:MAG: MBL fold metallo-hydrolase [Bacteroidales bacterium]
MKIQILGTRGEIDASAPWHSKHSGVLINDELMIDLGEESYLQYNPGFVLFSHFHPDHAFFMRKNNSLKQKIQAYGPEKPEELNDVNLVDEAFEKNGYHITPIPVIHSLKVKSLAYLIEKDGKRLLYTGDMAWIEKKYQKSLGQLDVVITEGSFIEKGGMIRRDKKSGKIYGHTGVPDIIRIFSKYTCRIILMHFGTWFMDDVKAGRDKIKEYSPEDTEVHAARDGEIFHV